VELVQYLITDAYIDPKIKERLESQGIKVLIAD